MVSDVHFPSFEALCGRNDDNSQPSAAGYFAADADNARPKVWRELGVTGVGEL